MKKETLELVKDIAYWKKNAEEDYLKVPISVLRYISELEKTMYSEEDMAESFIACWKANVSGGMECKLSFKEWFEQFKKK